MASLFSIFAGLILHFIFTFWANEFILASTQSRGVMEVMNVYNNKGLVLHYATAGIYNLRVLI